MPADVGTRRGRVGGALEVSNCARLLLADGWTGCLGGRRLTFSSGDEKDSKVWRIFLAVCVVAVAIDRGFAETFCLKGGSSGDEGLSGRVLLFSRRCPEEKYDVLPD
jgi:hypothetical protein